MLLRFYQDPEVSSGIFEFVPGSSEFYQKPKSAAAGKRFARRPGNALRSGWEALCAAAEKRFAQRPASALHSGWETLRAAAGKRFA